MREFQSQKALAGALLCGFMICGALLLLQAPQAWAQGVGDLRNVITTQGQSEVRVPPDSFQIDFAVENTAPTVDQARTENSRIMQQIITSIRGLNIPGLILETRHVQVYPIYERNHRRQPEPVQAGETPRPPQVVGYRFNSTVQARVTGQPGDALGETASRVMGAGLDGGANQMRSLNFFVDDLDPVRREALQKAVENARANATAMAQAAGVTVDSVHSIEGTPQYGIYARPYAAEMMRANAVADAAPIPVEPGETTVSGNVTVRFNFR